MKNIFSSRRNKSPHNNEEAEKSEAPFFSKENKTPFFNNKNAVVQTKLTIGQPNDKYEKEADTMADAVVNKSSKPDIQNKEISNIQRESLATPQEDEKLGTAEQRMEEDKLIQEKPGIQKMEEPEEDMVQKMEGEEEEGMINKMEEEEETLQTKSNGKSNTARQGLSQQIKSKSGKGRSLSKNTQAEMESSFNTDFSDVNVHTDLDATRMNKELNAQAFTHGKDVYFNSGKFNPNSSEGKHLLVHELTHVVQQNGKKKIHRKENNKIQPKPHALELGDKTNYRFDTYRISKDDLSDPEIINRIQALNWNGLIHYRDQVSDQEVKLYLQQIIKSYSSHEVALGYKIKDPPFTKKIDKLKVMVLADKSDTSISQAGITKYSFPDKINWVTHAKTKEVTSIDFNYVMTIQSNYKQLQDREGHSGYGYGTTQEDKKSNNTSLAYHEGQHVLDILSYLTANPLPTFGGKLGMSKTSIENEGSLYISALKAYKSQMDSFLMEKGDCVGISIDKYNASKGKTTQECKSTKQ